MQEAYQQKVVQQEPQPHEAAADGQVHVPQKEPFYEKAGVNNTANNIVPDQTTKVLINSLTPDKLDNLD